MRGPQRYIPGVTRQIPGLYVSLALHKKLGGESFLNLNVYFPTGAATRG